MREMNCYKMVRQAKMFSDAEMFCQKEGGSMAKPITKAQVLVHKHVSPGLVVIGGDSSTEGRGFKAWYLIERFNSVLEQYLGL